MEYNVLSLLPHRIICTGTTGVLVEQAILNKISREEARQLQLTKLKSGPLGGDQQLGALISDGKIDVLIFLWDPMEPQPHDVDVKALLRIAVLYNVPIANNRATADFLVSSTLFATEYKPTLKDYSSYISRPVYQL